MTDKPTDAEIDAFVQVCRGKGMWELAIFQAVLARWGQPAHSGEPILYDPKALLEAFKTAQAGSSGTAGTLRGIAAVIASWESRAEPHTWLIASPQPVVREPLPVIELMRIVMDVEQQHHFLRGTTNWASAVGRAVERAHGIKGDQHGAE